MRLPIFLALLSLLLVLPAAGADKPDTEPAAKRADRPQREAVKLSPRVRESAPRPDDSGRMRRVAPPPRESPLQDVPALREPPPVPGAPAKP